MGEGRGWAERRGEREQERIEWKMKRIRLSLLSPRHPQLFIPLLLDRAHSSTTPATITIPTNIFYKIKENKRKKRK